MRWLELLGPATGAGFGVIVLAVVLGCLVHSIRLDPKEDPMSQTQTDPRDPDTEDPDQVTNPGDPDGPSEPQRNPDEPEE